MKRIIINSVSGHYFNFNLTLHGDNSEFHRPNQVLIIANFKTFRFPSARQSLCSGRPDSFAKHDRFPLPTNEDITRDQYNTLLARPVRDVLTRMKLENKSNPGYDVRRSAKGGCCRRNGDRSQ
jgi:hypothetical protein